MSALTLPGTIPGLLRRGSPIVFTSDVYGDLHGTVHQVCEGHPGFPTVTFAADGNEYALQGAAEDAALDLTDATGRAHAAWWLARRFGLADVDHGVCWLYRGMWDLETPKMRVNFARGGPGGLRWMPIPALADLDPLDDTRLPDGSRLVDALALVAVCLHVANLPTEA